MVICLLVNCKEVLAIDEVSQETMQYVQKNEFIFESSDKEAIGEWELMILEPDVLALARNEIYARHGYIFKDEKYNKYFRERSWYRPIDGIGYDSLNAIEKYNVAIIKFYETYHNYYSKIPVSIKAVKKESIYEANKMVLEDLNGDGVKEKIEYRLLNTTEYGENAKANLIINGSSAELEGNLASQFAIVDIDRKDKYKELIISDYGPSSDHTSTFYIYKNNRLMSIGTTGGIFEDGLTIDSSGTFSASTRGAILQTWWFDKKYQLDKEHKIIPVPTNIYINNHLVYVKKYFKVYTKKDVSSKPFTVKTGQILVITGNDNKAWCRVKTEAGKEGWFRIRDFSFMPDTGEYAQVIFAGLNYAD
ncbi:MAG: hypothetical protein K0S71_1076 [Clostridia bacterium]|nr:hypothetical protein [Clostridia bacterium]